MSKTMDLIRKRGHKKEDEDSLRFYQMPKVLFKKDIYRSLSLGARAMYSVLRDRQELSKKNDWTDEEGTYFLIYTIENLAEELSISERTVSTYKKELTKAELLAEVRQGQGKPNRIYILKPNYETEDTFTQKDKESYPQGQPIDNTKTRKYCKSRLADIAGQDSQILQTNDTEFSENDSSETHSFIQEKENERMNDIYNHYDSILENIEIDYVEDNYKIAVKECIKTLCFSKSIKTNNMIIPQKIVLEDIKSLRYSHIEYSLNIYKERASEQQIRNPIIYLATIIYNSLSDMNIKIDAELRKSGVIN